MDSTLDLDATLGSLLPMIGERVTITVVSADGEPALLSVMTGTLTRGSQVAVDRGDPEAFYLALTRPSANGLFLHETAFKGSEHDGRALRVMLGPCVVTLEPAAKDD